MCAGEGQKQAVDDMLAAALEYYGERGELDASPVPITLERERKSGAAAGAASPLRYPGKIAADLAGGRLFVSDSSNHRSDLPAACPTPHAITPGSALRPALSAKPLSRTLLQAKTRLLVAHGWPLC